MAAVRPVFPSYSRYFDAKGSFWAFPPFFTSSCELGSIRTLYSPGAARFAAPWVTPTKRFRPSRSCRMRAVPLVWVGMNWTEPPLRGWPSASNTRPLTGYRVPEYGKGPRSPPDPAQTTSRGSWLDRGPRSFELTIADWEKASVSPLRQSHFHAWPHQARHANSLRAGESSQYHNVKYAHKHGGKEQTIRPPASMSLVAAATDGESTASGTCMRRPSETFWIGGAIPSAATLIRSH